MLSNSYKRVVLSITFFSFFAFSTSTDKNAYSKLESYLLLNTDLIIDYLDSIDVSVLPKKRTYYEKARKYYKEIEFAVEFASPFYSKYYINGPPIKKSELEFGNRLFEPHGFQLIESMIYSVPQESYEKKLHEEVVLLKDVLGQIKKKFKSYPLKDEVILEMLRLQTIRIVSLNLCGYDCSLNKLNTKETRSCFEGVKKTLAIFNTQLKQKNTLKELNSQISSAQNYLAANPDIDSFDRLHFIVTYFKPIYKLILTLEKELKLNHSPINYAVNLNTDNFFSPGAFNINYFSVVLKDSALRDKQITLGRLLFFDPLLSGNNKRACASCHKPELGYSDTIKANIDFEQKTSLKRNTPGLLNAYLQKAFFYEGRSLQLEDQVSDVLHNVKEMNSTPEEIIEKLRSCPDYKAYFNKAFKGTPDTIITYYAVLKSIAEYERSLTSLNSRFDNYLQGEKKKLNKSEINGFNIFTGKALCGTCHFFPLFNGLVPPLYNDTEFEVIGTPSARDNKAVDGDSGRITISKHSIHLFAFKTPSIRNIALTKPYMHNGIYKTLDEVIEFYRKGGGAGFKFNLPHQTLPFDSLQLTKTEISDIKAFLLTLTDNHFDSTKPVLPLSVHTELNKRKSGGEY